MSWKYPFFFMAIYLCFFGGLSPSSPAMYVPPVMTDSLVSAYYFNENAEDTQGLHPGEVQGSEISSDRFSATASSYRFDGQDDGVNLGLDFTSSLDSISISLWIYPYTQCEANDTLSIDSTDDQYFISSASVDSTTGIFGIWNKGALLMGQSLTDRQSQREYHSFLKDSIWHHIVVGFDAVEESIHVHVNGMLEFSLNYEEGSHIASVDSLLIGRSNLEIDKGFFGIIDDVKIYNRLLNEPDISTLYNEGCPDTLSIGYLQTQSDTFLFAKSAIFVDTLQLDTACNLEFIVPFVGLQDSSNLETLSSIRIQSTDGCRQPIAVHETHFEHRGIYINNFVVDGILGDTLKEDSLLAWTVTEGFNNLYLYNIGSALSSGMQSQLDSFVEKSNALDIDITFVSAGHGTSFDNLVSYHEDYPNIPQGIVSEIEFWNGSSHYDDDYAPWLERLDSLKWIPPMGATTALNPDLHRRFYIGKIKNPGESPSMAIAEDLVAHHDEIFLTNYHTDGFNLSTSSSENSIRNKLSLLATAAKNLNKEVAIVILFNVRQDSPSPNIWDYFNEEGEDHDFRAGYESFYHDFLSADDIDHKEFIRLKGYGIYRYSDALEARGYDD